MTENIGIHVKLESGEEINPNYLVKTLEKIRPGVAKILANKRNKGIEYVLKCTERAKEFVGWSQGEDPTYTQDDVEEHREYMDTIREERKKNQRERTSREFSNTFPSEVNEFFEFTDGAQTSIFDMRFSGADKYSLIKRKKEQRENEIKQIKPHKYQKVGSVTDRLRLGPIEEDIMFG